MLRHLPYYRLPKKRYVRNHTKSVIDFLRGFFSLPAGCFGTHHVAGLRQVRDERTEARAAHHSRPLSPFVSLGAIAVLIYLFRFEETDNLALTVDVTGANISPRHAVDRLVFRGGDRHTEARPLGHR
jgi:hypothetical protein